MHNDWELERPRDPHYLHVGLGKSPGQQRTLRAVEELARHHLVEATGCNDGSSVQSSGGGYRLRHLMREEMTELVAFYSKIVAVLDRGIGN